MTNKVIMDPSQFVERSSLEAHTHYLLADYQANANAEWSSVRVALCNTLRAMWFSSLTLARITAITNAMSSIEFDEADIEEELKRMYKNKVIRPRRMNGRVLWEITY